MPDSSTLRARSLGPFAGIVAGLALAACGTAPAPLDFVPFLQDPEPQQDPDPKPRPQATEPQETEPQEPEPQEPEPQEPEPWHGSLNLGVAETGISFGNSERVNGVRFNLIDDELKLVNGLNLTLWKPHRNPDAVVNGLALGLFAPAAGTLRGASFGLLMNVAHRRKVGVHAAGFLNASQGDALGINIGGLANNTRGSLSGINLAAFGNVGQGGLNGLSLSGLSSLSLLLSSTSA